MRPSKPACLLGWGHRPRNTDADMASEDPALRQGEGSPFTLEDLSWVKLPRIY